MENDNFSQDAVESSFIAEFYDGYSFKNLIDFLRRINITAIFEFHPHSIQCFHHDPEGTNILTHVLIESKELYKYHLKTPKKKLRVGINLRDLQKFIKSISKKDSLTLYKKSGEASIYIQISNSNNKSAQNNFSVFRPCNLEPLRINLPVYETSESTPSLVIPAVSVSSTFSALNVLKSSRVRIRVKGENLTVDNLTDDRSSGRVDSFPMRIYDTPPISYDILVKGMTLKCLTKLSILSPNGLLKIYLEKDQPLYISAKINSWGELRIYLRPVEI